MGFVGLSGLSAGAQENSPYSRYGLGDLFPSQHIATKGMGGISAAISSPQFVNFINPASFSSLKVTTYDIGLDYTSHGMRSGNAGDKYTSKNLIVSYLQMGIPLSKRAGMSFGLRPISNISYKIARQERLGNIDSLTTLYEGDGGAYRANLGAGISFGNLSLGANFGYLFGRKENTTRLQFNNDTVLYYKSEHINRSSFGNFFMNLGMQYTLKLEKDALLRFGFFGNMQQKLKTKNDFIVQTFVVDAAGATQRLDSMYETLDQKGTIIYPASFGGGLVYEKENKLTVGLEFNGTSWKNYRFNGERDSLQNAWTVRGGIQFIPNVKEEKKYWSLVSYRMGFHYGQNYLKIRNNIPEYGFTFGLGLPVRKRDFNSSQFTVVNTAFEVGRRGNNNTPLKENYFRVSLGVSLSDFWFRKSKFY